MTDYAQKPIDTGEQDLGLGLICETAKLNPLIIRQAVGFYEKSAKSDPLPAFTFLSLWNDEEPYPIKELISVLTAKIERADSTLWQYPNNDSLIREWAVWKQWLARMEKIAKTANKSRGTAQ